MDTFVSCFYEFPCVWRGLCPRSPEWLEPKIFPRFVAHTRVMRVLVRVTALRTHCWEPVVIRGVTHGELDRVRVGGESFTPFPSLTA